MSPLRVVGVLFLVLHGHLVSAFQQGGTNQDALSTPDYPLDTTSDRQLDIDIAQVTALDLTESMQKRVQLLNSLKSKPACEQVATADLLLSCTAFDSPAATAEDGTALDLEGFKTLYAARLAVCELNAVPNSVPVACQPFIPTDVSTGRSVYRSLFGNGGAGPLRQTYPLYEQDTVEHLDQCMLALRGCPSCWVSFSNSRKNAKDICRDARADQEKNEKIHVYEQMVELTTDVTGALSQSRAQWEAAVVAVDELRNTVRNTVLDLVKGDAERTEAFNRMLTDLEVKAREGVLDISREVETVRDALRDTQNSLSEHRGDLQVAFQKGEAQLKDLVAGHVKGMDAANYKAELLGDMIAYLQETAMQALAQGLYSATQDVAVVNAGMAQLQNGLHQNNVELSQQIDVVSLLLYQLNDLGVALQRTQVDNTRMMHDLQANVSLTIAMVDKANQNVEKLGAGIASFADFLSGGWLRAVGFFSTAGNFTFQAAIFGLLSLGLWQLLTRYSILGCIAASIATGLVFASISVQLDLHHFIFDNTASSQVIYIVIALLAFTIVIAVIWCSYLRYALRTVQSRMDVSKNGLSCTAQDDEHAEMHAHGLRWETKEENEDYRQEQYERQRNMV